MWEVIEHIHEKDLKQLIENVRKHLNPGGLFIISVTNKSDAPQGVELHQTIKPKQWWIEQIECEGLHYREEYLDYFNGQYIRGRKQTNEYFNLVFSNDNSKHHVPRLTMKDKLVDSWIGSKFHRIIKQGIV